MRPNIHNIHDLGLRVILGLEQVSLTLPLVRRFVHVISLVCASLLAWQAASPSGVRDPTGIMGLVGLVIILWRWVRDMRTLSVMNG